MILTRNNGKSPPHVVTSLNLVKQKFFLKIGLSLISGAVYPKLAWRDTLKP
jgi:hypothetical protein